MWAQRNATPEQTRQQSLQVRIAKTAERSEVLFGRRVKITLVNACLMHISLIVSMSFLASWVRSTRINMELSLFLSMLGFLWVAAITPGPNNMLLTASAANFGFLRSFSLLIGIMIGMQVMLLMVAFGVGSLILVYPSLHLALKVAGSLYLLWLAWKIATAEYEQLDTDAAPPVPTPFWQGGLLQLINPKAWLMALGAVASFSLAGAAYLHSVVAISIGMALVNVVSGVIWMGFGSLIGRLLRSPRAWKIFNLAMGILTATCVLLIWH